MKQTETVLGNTGVVDGAESPHKISAANTSPVLSAGEWSALLYQCPDAVKPLLVRLAIHHGAMEPPRDGRACALCGERKEATP